MSGVLRVINALQDNFVRFINIIFVRQITKTRRFFRFWNCFRCFTGQSPLGLPGVEMYPRNLQNVILSPLAALSYNMTTHVLLYKDVTADIQGHGLVLECNSACHDFLPKCLRCVIHCFYFTISLLMLSCLFCNSV